VKAKAKERLMALAEPAIVVLGQVLRDEKVAPADRIRAAVAILDRAGFPAGLKIDADVDARITPYLEVLQDLFERPAVETTKTKRRKAVAAPDAGTPASEILASLAAEAQPPRREPANVIEGEFVNGDDTPPWSFNSPRGHSR
jgi:hypothetical protein